MALHFQYLEIDGVEFDTYWQNGGYKKISDIIFAECHIFIVSNLCQTPQNILVYNITLLVGTVLPLSNLEFPSGKAEISINRKKLNKNSTNSIFKFP
jgi:hypothetical protein